MAKEKVTLTLDSGNLRQLRALVGARSLSVAADAAVRSYLERLGHLGAVDELLVEIEREHGPIPVETLEWAAKLVGDWASSRSKRRRRAS